MAKGNKATPNFSLEGLGFSGLNSNPVVQKANNQRAAEDANSIFKIDTADKIGVGFGDYAASEYQTAIDKGAGLTGSDEDIEHRLGDVQDTGEQFGTAIARFAPMTAIQLTQSLTNMAAGVKYLATGNKDWLNPDASFNKYLNDISDDLKNVLPIHATEAYDNGNISKQLMSSKFWTDDAASGLGFLVAQAIGSKGVAGGLKLLGSGIGALAESSGSLAALYRAVPITERIAAATAHNFTVGTVGFLNAASESAFQASDTNRQIKEKLKEKYGSQINPETGDYYTPAEIDQQVSLRQGTIDQKTNNTFWATMATLLLPSIYESKLFLGAAKTQMGELNSDIVKAVNSGATTLGELEAGVGFDVMKKTGWKAAIKEAGKGALAEGIFEEGVENAIQKYDVDQATAGNKDGVWDSKFGYLRSFLDGFTDKDGLKAMILGSILGGGMGAAHAVGEAKEYNESLRGHIDSMNAADNIYGPAVRTIYKTDPKDPNKIMTDDDGQPVEDVEKLQKLTFQMLHDKNNWDNQTAAVLAGNTDMATMNEHVALSQSIVRELQSGRYDSVDNAREYFKWFHGQRIKEQALQAAKEQQDNDVSGSAKTDTEDPAAGDAAAIKTASAMKTGSAKSDADLSIRVNANSTAIDKMFDLWKTTEKQASKLTRLGQGADREAYNNTVRRTLYYEAIKREALLDMVKDRETAMRETGSDREKLNNETNALQKLIQDSETRTSEYLGNKSGLFENWTKLNSTREKLLNDAATSEREMTANKEDASREKLGRKANTANYMLQEHTAKEGIGMSGFAGAEVDPNTGSINVPGTDGNGTSQFSINQSMPLRAATPVGLRQEGQYKAGLDYLKMSRLRELISKVREGKASVREAVGYANDNISSIDTGTRKELSNLVTEESQKVTKDQEKLSTMTEMDEDTFEFNPEYGALSTDINNRKEAIDASQKILTQNARQSELDQLSGTPEQIEDTLNKRFAEKSFVRANNVIANALEDDGSVKETYADERAVRDASAQVTSMRDAIQDRLDDGDLKGKTGYNYLIAKANEILTQLSKIQDAVVDNKLKRDGIQKAINQQEAVANVSALGFNLDTNSITNPAVYNLVDSVLEGKLGDMLGQIRELSSGNHYEATTAILHAIKTKASAEELSTIKDLMDEQADGLIASLPELNVNKGLVKNFSKSPALYFENIYLAMYKGQESPGSEKNSPLSNFRRRNDINELESRLVSMTDEQIGTSKDNLLQLVRTYKSLIANERVHNLLNSSLDLSAVVGSELDRARDSDGIVPTAQQEIAIRDGLAWLTSNKGTGTGKFSGWGFLRGIAGTGKTNVTVKWMMGLSGLQADEVVTTAATRAAANVIGTATGTQALVADELIDGSIPSKTKLIIIDEYARITPERLEELEGKIRDYNKELSAQDRVKVLILGDPTQINPLDFSNQDITNPLANGGAKNIQVINPLTVVYRSEVSAVNEASDIFQDNSEAVSRINVRADRDLNTPLAVGTHTGTSGQDIVDVVTRNQKFEQDNGLAPRTRVIITDKPGQYQDLGIPVISVYDAQSETYDEAYVDLDKTNFNGDDKFNTAMYTAASRAREYSYLRYNEGVNTVDPGLSRERENNSKVGREAKGEYIKARTEEQTMMDAAVKGTDINTKPSEAAVKIAAEETPLEKAAEPDVDPEETEIVTEVASAPADEVLPVTGDPDGALDPVTEEESPIDSPLSSDSLFDGERMLPNIEKGTFEALDKRNQKIRAGSKVTFVYTKEQNGENAITGFVFDDEGNWIPISKVFQEEIDKHPNYAGWKKRTEGMQPLFSSDPQRLNATATKAAYSLDPSSVVDEATISRTQRMTYVFGNDPLQGTSIASHIKNIFRSKFFSSKASEQAKADTLHYKIFRDNELQSYKFAGFVPDKGIPYAIIGAKAGSTDYRGAQFVRLTANRLNQNSEHYRALKDFRDTAKKVEQATGVTPGTKDFTRVLKALKKGLSIVNEDTNQGSVPKVVFNENFTRKDFIAELEEVSDKSVEFQDPTEGLSNDEFERILPVMQNMASQIYGLQEQHSMMTEGEMQSAHGEDYEFLPSKTPEFRKGTEEQLGRARLKGTGANTGRKEILVKHQELSSGKGVAQQALNQIAKANEYVGNVRIRTEPVITSKKQVRKVPITGKKLTVSEGGDAQVHYSRKALAKILGEIRVQEGALDTTDLNRKEIRVGLENDIRKMSSQFDGSIQELGQNLLNDSQLEPERKTQLLNELENAATRKETLPVTMSTLDLMVGDENYENDEHLTAESFTVKNPKSGRTKETRTYLRTPLDIDQFNELGKSPEVNAEQLASMVGTKFQDLLPTQIAVVPANYVAAAQTNQAVEESIVPGAQQGIQEKIDLYDKQISEEKDVRKRLKLKREQQALLNERDASTRMFDENMRRSDRGSKITVAQAREQIRQMLPSVTDDQMNFYTTSMMLELQRPGESLLGLYQKGRMFFLEDDGSVYSNVVRHEVFHTVFNDYLSQRDRNNVAREFDPQGKMTPTELEEALADKFMGWRTSPETVSGKIKRLFNRILNWFGLSGSKPVAQLFDDINNGVFQKPNASPANARMAFSDIKKYGSVTNYKNAAKYIQGLIKDNFIDNNIDNMPLTQGELFGTVKRAIQEREQRYSSKIDGLIEDMHQLQSVLDAESDPEVQKELVEEMEATNEQIAEDNQLYAMLNTLNSENTLKELWTDLYPNFKFQKEGIVSFDEDEVQEDPEAAEVDEDQADSKANGSIAADFVQQSDERNQEQKVSQNVKNFLSFIYRPDRITREGKQFGGRINPRGVYLQSLRNLSGLQSSDTDFIDQLSKRAAENGINLSGTSDGAIIVNHIIELYHNATSDRYEFTTSIKDKQGRSQRKEVNLNRTMRFLDDNTFLISLDGRDISGITEPNDNVMTVSRGNRTTAAFLADVAGTGVSMDEAKGYFRQHQAQETMRELMSNFLSQRESTPMIAEEVRGFKTVLKYFRAQNYGVERIKTTEIENAFKDKFYSVTPEQWSSFTDIKGDNISGQSAAVASLLKAMGVRGTDGIKSLSNNTVRTVYGDIVAFRKVVQDLDAIPLKEANTEATDSDETFAPVSNVAAALERNSGMLDRLTRLLTLNNSDNRASSYTDTTGTKRYLFHNGSQAHDVLNKVVRFFGDKIGSLPEHLTQDTVLSKNIFTEGNLNRIYEVLDHDGQRQEGKEEFATGYSGESNAQWLKRNFSDAFLTFTKTNARDNADPLTYMQNFYTISNRPRMVGARVRILNNVELKEAITKAIEQHVEQPDLKSVKNYDRFKAVNFDEFHKAVSELFLDSKTVKELAKNTEGRVELARIYSNLQTSSDLKEKVADHIVEQLKVQAEIAMERMRDENVTLGSDVADAMKLLKDKRRQILSDEDPTVDAQINQKEGWPELDQMRPTVQSFYMNNYINSYFLNQLVAGNMNYFKDGLDMVKRMSGVFAPGTKGMVGDKFFMAKKFNVAISADPKMKADLLSDIFKDTKLAEAVGRKAFDLADAQGFMLPERADNIVQGFGKAYNAGAVFKPAHYEVAKRTVDGVTTYIPVMLKYSSVVLSDNLVDRFPKLKALRDAMRGDGTHPVVHEFIFDSGTKVGATADQVKLPGATEYDNNNISISPNSVVELSGENYRLQLNPAHDAYSRTSNPTQLGYFLNVLHKLGEKGNPNESNADNVYGAIAEKITRGIQSLSSDVTDAGGKFKITSIRNMLNGAGNERLQEMLSSGVDYNMPNIVDKAMIQMANLVSKDTVKITFPGGKMVLQASYGIDIPAGLTENDKNFWTKYAISESDKEKSRRLEYKVDPATGRWHAEVLLPMIYKEKANPGDFLLPDAMGFRIPSTELHSSLPLKIAGFYDDRGSNVVIGPAELVAQHGSDFDVDSLYVISREQASRNIDTYNFSIAKGAPVGYYSSGDKLEFNGTRFRNELEQAKLDAADDKRTLKQLEKLHDQFLNNQITEAFLDTISHPANRQRMLTPISTDVIEDSLDALKIDRSNSVNLSRLLDNLQVFNSNFQGASLVGIFANGMKALSYMSRAGLRTETGTDAYPQVKQSVEWNGRTYDNFTEIDHTGGNLWEELDALVNTSVDNVKEQKLYHMNATDRTGPVYVAAKAIGMPLTDAMRMMLQPVVKQFAAVEGGRATIMANLKSRMVAKGVELGVITESQKYTDLEESLKEFGHPDEKQLNKAIRTGPEGLSLGMTKEEFAHQYRVLQEFEKVNKMADDITTFSRAISILQDMPVFYKDITGKVEQWDKLGTVENGSLKTNEDFSFQIDNLMEVQPNIKAAYEAFQWLKKSVDTSIIKHYPETTALANQLADSMKIRLVFDRAGNIEAIKNEVMSYLISSYYAPELANQKSVTVERKKGNPITLTGRAAWSQEFTGRVAAALKANAESDIVNPFLKRLEVQEKYGINSIQFANASNPDPEESLEMQEGFNAIEDAQLKSDFVKYAVLNYGLSFGIKNYSMFIPSELLQPVSNYITQDIKRLVQSSSRDAEGKLIAGPLKNMAENLAIRMAVNNIERLPFISNTRIPAVQSLNEKGEPAYTEEAVPIMSGYNGEYYWHRAYSNPIEGEGGKHKYGDEQLPQFFRKNDGNGRPVAYYRLNDPAISDTVYYQRIGYKNYSGGYDASMEAINRGYDPENYFAKGVIPIPVSDVQSSPYAVRNEFVQPGVEVIVYPYSNDTREQGIRGIVDKVNKPLGGGDKITFTLKAATEGNPLTDSPARRNMEIAANVTSRFGLSLATDENLTAKGMVQNGIVTLNPKLMTADTAFHEVAHPLIAGIQQQNPAWYKSLASELRNTTDGKSILNKVKAKYPELDSKGQEVEALVTAIGLEAAQRLEKSNFRTLVRRLMRSVGTLLRSVINEVRTKGGISLDTLANEDMVKLSIGDIADILAAKDVKLGLNLSEVKDAPQFSKDLGDEKPESGSIMQDILAKAETIGDPEKLEDGQEADTYTVDGKGLLRVSKLMDKFTFRDKTAPLGADGKPMSTIDAIATREADRMFKNVAPGGKLIIDGIEQSKQEFTDSKKKIQLAARVKGDIIHAKIQRYMAVLQGDVPKVNELDGRIAELSSMVDKLPSAYDWVTSKHVFSKLMSNAGVNITAKDKAQQDKIYSEVKVASSLLGAGKIDQLVEKPDGRLRIVDWKTGSRLKDKYSANILKYGIQENRITDNPLDRAKLQVMMYALMVKAENPAAKFDGLVVMHLPNEFEATQARNALGVEVRDYLRMIQQYYKNEEPGIYRQLLDKSPKLFDPREYNAPRNADFTQDLLNSNGASEAEVLEKARLDLQRLVLSIEMRKAENSNIGWSKEELKLREELLKKIRQANGYINADFTGALDAKNEISMMTRWLGNLNDTHNPYIQNFAQELAVNRDKARKEFDAKQLEFRRLLKPVIEDRVGKRSVAQNAISWVDKEKVFSNLWNETETIADDGTKYLRRGLTTEKDEKWSKLSPAEQALSKYMRTEMKGVFDEVMTSGKHAVVSTDEKGQPMNKLDLYNKSRRGANFKYEADFVPRIAITAEEVQQRALKQGWKGATNYVKDVFLRHATDYFENNIEGQNQKDYGMPVRFLGNGNTYVSPESYSTDLQLSFERYMEQMINKKHLDPTWMYGQAVKGLLESTNDENGNAAFKNTASFLDFHMNNILVGDRLQRSSKGITRHGFTVGRKTGNEYNVSTLKVYRALKGGIAAGTLWLQPVRSAKNALQATFMVAKEAGVGSIGQMVGIRPEELDLTYANHANSYGEAIASQAALFTGSKDKNFVHTLARTLRLYPDMELGRGNDSMTRGATLLNKENFGFLYSMPEEVTTMQYALNYLKTMKVQSGKYAGKTMYQMYKDSYKVNDAGDGYFDLPADFVRGKIEKGDGTFETLAGLHPLEVQKLQRGIQKVKGGYKPDEKTAIQATILGDAFMTFKRWIPSMLVSQFKSKYEDASIGQFELQTVGDKLRQRDGEPVYEWRARVVEGRGRVIANMFMNMVGLNKYSGYNWADLSGEQKKAVIDLGISLATWMSMLGFTAGVLGDRDEEDSLRKFSADMTGRYFEQWSVPTLADAALQPPAAVKKSLDVFKGFQTLVAAGYTHAITGDDKDLYTNKGDIKGMNVLLKNIPLVSSYYETSKFNESTDEGSVWDAISGY